MNEKTILALVLLTGCNAGDVQPPPTPGPATDGGYGDTGVSETDTEGSNPDECWGANAPAGAVRWQCEGLAEAAIFGTLHVEIPDGIDNADAIREVIEGGRLDFNALFGPWSGEAYDEPGVDACCLPSVVGDDAEAADETGADTGGDAIPQAAEACVNDCADQACRQIPRTLRDLADQAPVGIPLIGPSYRKQLNDLADWVAQNNNDCYDAMIIDGVREYAGAYIVDGEWQVPNDDRWPDVTELSVEGQCKVYDWYLPETGEPLACTGINDNNDEDPFGSGGSLGGFDTFAPIGGNMELDGPLVFGVQATGSAPVLGLGHACPRGECSRVDAWVTEDTLELQQMVLVAPTSMTWEQDGMRLTVDGLHAMVEHPLSIPLVSDDGEMRFEVPAGKLDVLFAGQVHGVPVKVTVPNVTPVTGIVVPLIDGSHTLVLDAFTVEHRDAYGSWQMHIDLGELIAVDHSPRATFSVHDPGASPTGDASASFDPDGDPLAFEWFLDGVSIGEGPQVTPVLPAGLSTLSLRVADDTGRSSWSYGLLTGEG